MSRLRRLARTWGGRAFEAARHHPVVTALLGAAFTVFLVGNVLVGMTPWGVALMLALVVAVARGLFRVWMVAHQRQGVALTPRGVGGRSLVCVGAAAVVMALVIQAVPYGRSHSNGPITGEPAWATPETRELMVRACYACHSNEVRYPAYADVAPVSWAVQAHVDSGRSEVNYSTFVTDPGAADETIEVILDGSMPPAYFTRFGRNPQARLTDDELRALIEGLRATPGMGG